MRVPMLRIMSMLIVMLLRAQIQQQQSALPPIFGLNQHQHPHPHGAAAPGAPGSALAMYSAPVLASLEFQQYLTTIDPAVLCELASVCCLCCTNVLALICKKCRDRRRTT